MSVKIFVDTNILIYAHDRDAKKKHTIAASLLETLWEEKTGILSVQVLQEFYVNITRKILKPISRAHARGIIKNYLAWQVDINSAETILIASEIEERYQLSFWDSLIIASASSANAGKIVTEDMNHGQIIEGLLIENPFVTE